MKTGNILWLGLAAIPIIIIATAGKSTPKTDPKSDPILAALQRALSEANIAIDAGYPDDWVMIPGTGLYPASQAKGILLSLIIAREQELGL